MTKSSSLYPQVDLSNPEAVSSSSSSASSSSLYPSIDMKDLARDVFPEDRQEPREELLIKIPGVIVHLIERERSIELACGDLTISHYFFTLRVPQNDDELSKEVELLNYGVTIASKGQEGLLKEFDKILECYSSFTVQEVRETENWELIDGNIAKGILPEELEKKKELMEESSAAYWTVLAPNVEDYSSSVARMIAAGSGQLIKGILWCGDVTVDRLKWGNEFLMKRVEKKSDTEISPDAMRRVKRVKRLTSMSEKVAIGILSGVVKVSGFFTSAIVNSKVGTKFFSLLAGEIVLASLDGFNKVCDAVEVAGKNVMSTSSVVTTGLVSQRYGEQAAEVTNEGLDAAGHAFGTAWAVFKIRKALNPRSAFKPATLAKAAAEANSPEMKAKHKK
ncbi:conserved hypothetical protein [Ricinus communis]|uniref:Senescence domain-containing protein n=1 Tax=Ricinus communis TaxID=3988 RepID=B9T7N4_RICCO|nr:conserved hypothetical protein [Ricinus communis]